MRRNAVWMLVLAAAVAFTVCSTVRRTQRVAYVSNLASHASPATARMGSLIVPERNERTLEWLSQTRQMLERKEWRVRHVGYDNAPNGRDVWLSSPYRWWLGTLAEIDQAVSGRPIVDSVERAAILADPLALLVFLIGGTWFVARTWGPVSAVVFAMGVSFVFPWAATFLPGVAEGRSIARLCEMAGVLALWRGVYAGASSRRWLIASAIALGVALWTDVPTAVPLVGGLIFGAALQECLSRPGMEGAQRAGRWRLWSLCGASVIGIAYLLEFAPDHLGGWHLESIHPLYGMVWVIGGEGLARISGFTPVQGRWLNGARMGGLALVVLAIGALPVGLQILNLRGFLVRDLLSIRLTSEPNGVVAPDLFNWIQRDGLTLSVVATLLPVLGLVGLCLSLGWKTCRETARNGGLLLLGPLSLLLWSASRNLSSWAMLDGIIIIALALTAAQISWRGIRAVVAALALAFSFVPGLIKLRPPAKPDANTLLAPAETEQLVERDLAQWLQRRAGEPGAVVFAPPRATLTLGYSGGFRGIGTFSPDNAAGFGTALSIAGAQTIVEVQAMLQARDVRYIVIPSWDPFFDEFGERYLAKNFSNRKSFLIGELRRGNLPLWLRPLAYPMPAIAGFEHQSALVFAVVEEQSPAIAASRYLDFLVETGELEKATVVQESLRRFPGDVAVLCAQANLLSAKDANQALGSTIEALDARLAAGADRYLPWDRRVNLAVVLARGGRVEVAREQCRRCLAEATNEKIRLLSDSSLYGLTVLSETFELPWKDAAQHELALSLLPAELRGKL